MKITALKLYIAGLIDYNEYMRLRKTEEAESCARDS